LTNYFNKENDTTDDITEWDNKFVTASEKSTWNWKQNAISDLATIRSNASAWKTAKDTIDTYWNIVTHNTSEFATSSQWWKADTAVQPWDLADIATSGALSDASGDSDDIAQGTTNLFLTSAERIKLSNTSWTNSWDETASAIKTKLWITTLSWSNTWDETQTSIKTKLWAATSSADWYLKKEDFATFNWKQNALVSGTNIKTINNTSVLWTWNIAVQPTISDLADIRSGASAWATALQPWDNISELNNDSGFVTSSYHDSSKQDTLVNQTNIKSVNWNSLLGSWNLSLYSTITVTLTSAGWSSSTQTVTATGVTASNTVIVSPSPANIEDYATCKVYCSAQWSNSLTFKCSDTPSNDISVNVAIFEVAVQLQTYEQIIAMTVDNAITELNTHPSDYYGMFSSNNHIVSWTYVTNWLWILSLWDNNVYNFYNNQYFYANWPLPTTYDVAYYDNGTWKKKHYSWK
jgi:hypothetical protein